MDRFLIKKPKAVDPESNGSARRKLQFDSSSASASAPKRKKAKSQIQQSIGQALKLKSNLNLHNPRANFLEQAFPDPASMPADHRVTEIQFIRESLSAAAPTIRRQPIQQLPLNDEQRRVAECPPDKPLSVRAGAGSGKTHTMVQRAVNLVNNYDIDPKKLLLITFSNKATEELKERITAAFSSNDYPDEDLHLPTIKTFHALAFSWICRCWRACGLGKFPSPLAKLSQERSLMRLAIEENLNNLRLERCRQMLWNADERPSEVDWELVVETFRERHQKEYDDLDLKADEKAHKEMPAKKMLEALTAEEGQELNEAIKARRKSYLRLECYLELLRRKKAEQKSRSEDDLGKDGNKRQVNCDLSGRWSGNNAQCDLFLDMIRKARLGRHDKNEYLPEDATVWEIYEKLQSSTGKIDFDSMLVIFTEKVLSNETLAQRFHSMYTHVIVDEYQDNSEAQALMLNKIVQHGCLTVVGDDDQCIYQFRGASPGNFNRLKHFFSEERQTEIQEETLTENHRSSANILTVAAAFLEGDTRRHPKVLRPTRPPGMPVEVWQCHYAQDQATHIVSSIIDRHENEGVAYGDMACLFRCFRMGKMGALNTHLQKELATKNVPFVVVGGSTIFERASVRNLLAYLCLSMRGSPDDESFERVINRPKRRLPEKKLITLIKKQKSILASQIFQCKISQAKQQTVLPTNSKHATSLQEAAEMMCKTGISLSSSRHKSLKGFLALIDRLAGQVNKKALPELLKFIWHETGLDDFHTKQQPKKKDGEKKDAHAIDGDEESSLEDTDGDESDESRLDLSTFTPNTSKQQKFPLEIELLIDLATRHVRDWKQREEKVIAKSKCQTVPSLVELTRNVIVKNQDLIDEIDKLPDHLEDDIILAPAALGRAVIRDFLACTALQNSVENEESALSNDEVGRVSISTVHRSKGLEWSDVYCPFFNQGFLPTDARDENGEGEQGQRHLPNCGAMQGDRCDKSCAQKFQELDAEKLGATKEERHLNEERRLAHVAATRAKDKLVFTIFQSLHTSGRVFAYQQSEFMGELHSLPKSVIKVINKP
ncbi:hypothetical protein ACHAXR_011588 [Thalassiosira sp. AJA248-18]